jgi:hypothetical protein
MPIFYWQEGKQENGLLVKPKPFAPDSYRMTKLNLGIKKRINSKAYPLYL